MARLRGLATKTLVDDMPRHTALSTRVLVGARETRGVGLPCEQVPFPAPSSPQRRPGASCTHVCSRPAPSAGSVKHLQIVSESCVVLRFFFSCSHSLAPRRRPMHNSQCRAGQAGQRSRCSSVRPVPSNSPTRRSCGSPPSRDAPRTAIAHCGRGSTRCVRAARRAIPPPVLAENGCRAWTSSSESARQHTTICATRLPCYRLINRRGHGRWPPRVARWASRAARCRVMARARLCAANCHRLSGAPASRIRNWLTAEDGGRIGL